MEAEQRLLRSVASRGSMVHRRQSLPVNLTVSDFRQHLLRRPLRNQPNVRSNVSTCGIDIAILRQVAQYAHACKRAVVFVDIDTGILRSELIF